MKIYYIAFLFLGLTIFAGCKKDYGTYVAFDDVEYVDKFPSTFSLTGGELLDLDVIGALDLKIVDSLLIVSTKNPNGFLSFFSMPDYEDLGKYIVKGRGPDEMLSPPWVNQQSFRHDGGSLYATIYEFNKGTIRKMNITETLNSGKLKIENLEISLPAPLFYFHVLGENTFMGTTLRDNSGVDKRYVLDNGEQIIPENLERLNGFSVGPDSDYNILATNKQIKDDGSRMAEASQDLNQINLYSIKDNSFAKTICVGKKLISIESVEEQDPMTKRYYYMDECSFPDFFGAIYLNDLKYNYEIGKTQNPTIQFFDWDGNPLAEVKMDEMITGFDIDFANGSLYTINHSTEEIYKYDIRDILEKLKR